MLLPYCCNCALVVPDIVVWFYKKEQSHHWFCYPSLAQREPRRSQIDVSGSRKAVVIHVPYRLRKAFRKIHLRLVRELEKKFSEKDVVVIATRRMLRPPKKGSAAQRPRSRTLTAVHDAMLEDVVHPAKFGHDIVILNNIRRSQLKNVYKLVTCATVSSNSVGSRPASLEIFFLECPKKALDDGITVTIMLDALSRIYCVLEKKINVNSTHSRRLKSYPRDKMHDFQKNRGRYLYNRFLKNRLNEVDFSVSL